MAWGGCSPPPKYHCDQSRTLHPTQIQFLVFLHHYFFQMFSDSANKSAHVGHGVSDMFSITALMLCLSFQVSWWAFPLPELWNGCNSFKIYRTRRSNRNRPIQNQARSQVMARHEHNPDQTQLWTLPLNDSCVWVGVLGYKHSGFFVYTYERIVNSHMMQVWV